MYVYKYPIPVGKAQISQQKSHLNTVFLAHSCLEKIHACFKANTYVRKPS